MELRTFGGLALRPATFTRPKPLLLVAYLALEGRQARPRLAHLLWPGAADRMKSLTVALARLRKGAPGLIDADRRHVWITASSDAGRFLALLEEGDGEGALALYTGPFLDGSRPPDCSVEFEEWVVETREFLAGCVRAALLGIADRQAARGRHREAARSAASAYALAGAPAPEPEELRRLHDLLRAGGHPVAAAVRAEAKELGVDLAGSPVDARARSSRTARGGGHAMAHDLPARGTVFVGRERELAEVASLLSRPWCRMVTILGPAGVGKTRLAVQTATEQLERNVHRDGVHFVSLESIVSPNALPAVVADALRLDAAGPADPTERVVERIGSRSVLLLFDNVEHVTNAADVLSRLLEACPNLVLLSTSRERLNLEQEHVVPIRGLPFPSDGVSTPDEASTFDAVRLFVQRAKRARPEHELTVENVRATVEVCRLVEGLPLGLELAAAWVRFLPCEEIAREIERDLDFLATTTRNVPPRHRSMRAAFEHSWRLLAARDQEVLRRLSVFRGGFTREAAHEVVGASVPVLASLSDKSLVRIDRSSRYDRHPLLYAYMREKAAAHPEEAADARAKHAAYFTERLRAWRSELHGRNRKRALAAVEADMENLRAAWVDPGAAGDLGDLPEVAWTLVEFFESRQAFHEGSEFLDGLLARAGEARRVARGHLLVARGRLALRLGSYAEAEDLAGRGLACLGPHSDRRGRLEGLRVEGAVALHRGAYAEAERRYEEALRLARALDDPREVGIGLGDRGLVLTMRGDHGAARRHLERALRLARDHENRLQVVAQLNNLGLLHDHAGDLVKAHDRWREALRTSREVDDRRMTLKLLVNLGLVAYKLGDHEQARERNREALVEARKAGDRMLESVVLSKQAWVEMALRRTDDAQALFGRALGIALEIGETPRILEYLGGMAEVRVLQGRPARAVRLLSLLKHHDLAAGSTRLEAERWLRQLAGRVPASEFAAAVEAGEAVRVEEVVAQLVEEARSRS